MPSKTPTESFTEHRKFFDENWKPVDRPEDATYIRVWHADGRSQTLVREQGQAKEERGHE